MNTATISGCDVCKEDLTNKEWRICTNCGRRYRSFRVPYLNEIRKTNLKKYGLIVWLLMNHVIVIRDVILINETNKLVFASTLIGVIAMQTIITRYVLKNIQPKMPDEA